MNLMQLTGHRCLRSFVGLRDGCLPLGSVFVISEILIILLFLSSLSCLALPNPPFLWAQVLLQNLPVPYLPSWSLPHDSQGRIYNCNSIRRDVFRTVAGSYLSLIMELLFFVTNLNKCCKTTVRAAIGVLWKTIGNCGTRTIWEERNCF